jgi:hypothetical protein
MRINQATMCMAVQHYLETQVFRDGVCPKVSSIEMVTERDGYEEKGMFRVTLSSEEKSS